jgi:hypothetical protein
MKSLVTLFVCLLFLMPVSAETVEPRADRALHSMSQYLASLKSFSFQVTTEFDQEIGSRWVEFSDTSDIYVTRPNGVRADRWGDKGRKQAFYNGQDFVIYSPEKKYFSTAPIQGDIPDMLDFAHHELGMTLPVADFLFPDPYAILTADVESGFYVGLHSVDSIPCHHLAFRNSSGIEWQLWIEDGKMRVPRKIVIRHGQEKDAPRFKAVFSKWDAHTPIPADMFDFSPPDDSVEIPHKVRGEES